jgi:hypothetical protein
VTEDEAGDVAQRPLPAELVDARLEPAQQQRTE